MKKFSSITRVNSRRISQTRKRYQIVIITLVCIGLLLLLPVVLRTAASFVVAPIVMTKDWFAESGSSLPQYLRNRSELLEEMSILRSELAAQGGEQFTIETLQQENERLRDLLGYEANDRVLAAVIGRPNQLPYDSLMLDRGTLDGVKEGAPVYIGDNTVIGIVKSAAPQTALVELITSPGFRATVFIMGPDIYTNAIGIGGGQLQVGVPQGIALNEGDMVVLPSVSSGVYGSVSTVLSVPTRPEQYGFVSPEIPLSGIRYVAVGTTPVQSISFDEAQEILDANRTEILTVPVPEGVLVDTFSTTTATTTATTSLEAATSTPE